MKTLLDLKDNANLQLKLSYINCLKSESQIEQNEMLLTWKTFNGYENMDLAHTDYFIALCKSTPIEVSTLS